MKEVSVIITTYERPVKTLCRAVASVASQSYPFIDLAVVDDNPENDKLSDDTIRLLNDTYGKKINYLSYKGNKGACYARNHGAKHTIGEYIAFLDDDDEWLPDKISEQVATIESKNCAMVTCDSYLVQFDDDGNPFEEYSSYTDNITISRDDLFTQGNVIGGASFPLMRRDCFTRAGGFTEELKACQDWDLWIRMLAAETAVRIPKALTKYYWTPGANISMNWDNKIMGVSYMIKTHSDLAPDKKKWIGSQYRFLADLALTLERYGDAINFISKEFTFDPSVNTLRKVSSQITYLFKKTVWYKFKTYAKKSSH